MGTPISAPNTMTAVALRSACFQALGSNGAAATKSISSSSAATSRGEAMLLASGMKISAEPKPENPRAVPETKAIRQIATAAKVESSAGMRPARLIPAACRRSSCVTSATIFAATASISSSVMVFSRGCIVTAIASDFLPGSMPLPS